MHTALAVVWFPATAYCYGECISRAPGCGAMKNAVARNHFVFHHDLKLDQNTVMLNKGISFKCRQRKVKPFDDTFEE